MAKHGAHGKESCYLDLCHSIYKTRNDEDGDDDGHAAYLRPGSVTAGTACWWSDRSEGRGDL